MSRTSTSQKCILAVSCLSIVGLLTTQPVLAQRMQSNKYEKGTLEKGKKTGIWEYYGYTISGEQVVVQRYDHDKNKLVFFRPLPYATYLTEVKPDQWKYVQPDQPPMFIGGSEALATYTSQLVYPLNAKNQGLQGRVVVTFRIDTLGQASGFRLTQRIGRECDEEAMRVARTVPQTWVPARIGSHAVAVEYELPFNFRLGRR